MSIVYSSFYLDVYRIYTHFKSLNINDTYYYCLCKCAKKILSNYQEEEYQALKKYFYQTIKYLPTPEEQLVFFILISIYKDKLKAYSSHILCAIIKSFVACKVNPNNYQLYMDMFLDENVYDLLLLMDLFTVFQPFLEVCSMIIYRINITDIQNKHYDNIVKMLSSMLNIRYSPYFNSNYSFSSMYDVLYQMMQEVNQEEYTFSEKDFFTLQKMLEFPEKLSNLEVEELKNHIEALENKFAHKKRAFIKAFLLQIEIFFQKSALGLYLIKNEKQESSY